MNDTVHIRPAEVQDLAAVARLAASLLLMHHQMDPARFFLPGDVEKGYRWWLERELANQDAIVLVAVREAPSQAVVGYLYGRIEDRDWNALLARHAALHDILVHEDARRMGAAEKLVGEFHTVVRARGITQTVLHTATGNERAQALFRKMGYRPTMIEMTRDEP